MITLIGMCPDDRADWPIMPNCGDRNASSNNCATQTSLSNVQLTNVTIAGTTVRTWNTSSGWIARASNEVSILKAHGALNTTVNSPKGPVNTPLNKAASEQSGMGSLMTGDAVKADVGGKGKSSGNKTTPS